ncbi:unnamed protein product [Fusarium graminearum]|uniref:Chromosome 1, complete genome n=1 Tax=Gibberella zeae (strain ATCC MYA-4620 / CBS 123657 / FGSC 9075 / NRRL 31084 / PH-1) TaxID=229533 RepID=I1S4K6_GIBZE|nr:hypothetical protein FGSG_11774 [Fusarium graminearum PH-1]ESU05705.1 hypothetical protein FGSG_11774 [Fusarium graminearum PH-1]CEF72457.1 unnamed protein product [Fusarium graminearum]CZS75720.1 unnamed protein product [Fusarium graminearum]|eukprot:XP_011316190.1 hypothetical protein FGSG_11774 [Fusarium graminearum PH-1]
MAWHGMAWHLTPPLARKVGFSGSLPGSHSLLPLLSSPPAPDLTSPCLRLYMPSCLPYTPPALFFPSSEVRAAAARCVKTWQSAKNTHPYPFRPSPLYCAAAHQAIV